MFLKTLALIYGCFFLDELDELQRLIIRHSFFQPLLTRFDSKFDMREAYCSSSNDVYKNSSSSRIEKEWLGNVPFSLKIFNDQILVTFLPILFRGASTQRNETRGFFRLRISSKSKVEIKENLLIESVVPYKVA